jgi:hypothetical protein
MDGGAASTGEHGERDSGSLNVRLLMAAAAMLALPSSAMIAAGGVRPAPPAPAVSWQPVAARLGGTTADAARAGPNLVVLTRLGNCRFGVATLHGPRTLHARTISSRRARATCGPVRLGANPTGAAVVAWEERIDMPSPRGAVYTIWGASRPSRDAPFGRPALLSLARTQARNPSAVMTSAGAAIVAWWDESGVKAAVRDPRRTWAPQQTVGPGQHISGDLTVHLAANARGDVIAEWGQFGNKLAVAWRRPDGTWSAPDRFGMGTLGGGALALASDGTFTTVWTAIKPGGEYALFTRSGMVGGELGPEQEVASSGVGAYALAVDAGGAAAIAFNSSEGPFPAPFAAIVAIARTSDSAAWSAPIPIPPGSPLARLGGVTPLGKARFAVTWGAGRRSASTVIRSDGAVLAGRVTFPSGFRLTELLDRSGRRPGGIARSSAGPVALTILTGG